MNCGVKRYRGDVPEMFGLDRSWRWAFKVEHLWLAKRAGYKLVEVPIEWNHKKGSKVHVWRDCVFTLWEIFGIKVRQIAGIYSHWKA
jgi:dolichyl-phosphate beta-glucosyltransferase